MFLMLVMLGFGMMIPQTAQAATTLTTAPCEDSLDNDGGNCGTGPQWNARIAIAPYAQVVADDTYTFIGVTHPSLATAHTTIGVIVEALNMTTVPNTKAGRAAVFTVSAGETHRVFVINQSHATINLNNAAFTDTQTHLITTTDASQFGNIKVWGVGTHPAHAHPATYRPGVYTDSDAILRHDNLSQLAMWGVIYKTSNGAGFAMEFVGDMHDSTSIDCVSRLIHLRGAAPCDAHPAATGFSEVEANTSGSGRGIN